MVEANDPCEYLAWDSDFFGHRIARVTANRLCHERIESILAWCNTHNIECLYFLGDADDPDTVRLAEDYGFRFVDIRIKLEKQLGNMPTVRTGAFQGMIRLCTPNDVPALRAIARVSHRSSRFYYDPNFPTSLCDALYETWIDKSCSEYADAVLVAEFEERPVGYISCHLLDQGKGQIGLLGVGSDAQGKGLGLGLVNESLRWFVEQGVTCAMVVTQGRNCRAQSLYQRCGFLTRSVQLWYHRWFPPREAKVVG